MMTLMLSITYKLFLKNCINNAKRIFLVTISNKMTKYPNNYSIPKKGIRSRPITIMIIVKYTRQIKFEVFLSIPAQIALVQVILM